MRSFVPSKASIGGILNFTERGKCSTPAVNEDFVCCTRASMEIRARPFTASFMWLSSYWMSWNYSGETGWPSPFGLRAKMGRASLAHIFLGQLLTSLTRCELRTKAGQNGLKLKKMLKLVIYLILSFFK